MLAGTEALTGLMLHISCTVSPGRKVEFGGGEVNTISAVAVAARVERMMKQARSDFFKVDFSLPLVDVVGRRCCCIVMAVFFSTFCFWLVGRLCAECVVIWLRFGSAVMVIFSPLLACCFASRFFSFLDTSIIFVYC